MIRAAAKLSTGRDLEADRNGDEASDEVEAFVEDVLPFDVQITALTPFPGTPLYDRLLAAPEGGTGG